jgi:hypothetical protein
MQTHFEAHATSTDFTQIFDVKGTRSGTGVDLCAERQYTPSGHVHVFGKTDHERSAPRRFHLWQA